jgi:hypothetical protein
MLAIVVTHALAARATAALAIAVAVGLRRTPTYTSVFFEPGYSGERW